MTFEQFFTTATGGNQPYDYQRRLAEDSVCESRLIEIPTGLGKTAAVVLAWLWNRVALPPLNSQPSALNSPQWPRRLVYCLPMRTLVEQTAGEVEKWLENLSKNAEELRLSDDGKRNFEWLKTNSPIILMGGENGSEWDVHPEREAILIGTQDMLLSRALNRGYGMRRYRWPMHFALLNNDALWIMDETQLMGVGVETGVQLAGFRERFGSTSPCPVWWMSATLDAARLATPEAPPRPDTIALTDTQQRLPAVEKRVTAEKRLRRVETDFLSGTQPLYTALAAEVRAAHVPGTLTLVVVNTVERAQELFRALCKGNGDLPLTLLHSRFRPHERDPLIAKVLATKGDHLVISTQVIEAGADLSARTLFTELAPWSSLVQRFGRCHRHGEMKSTGADIRWIDVPTDKVVPYSKDEMEAARALLGDCTDVSLSALAQVAAPMLPEPPRHVVRPKDLLELFDTTADIAGADLDVSRFIRDQTEETDCAVFWRTTAPAEGERDGPARAELCPVSVSKLRDFFGKRLNKVWTWDALDRCWVEAERLVPGREYWLEASLGGYDLALGFDRTSKAAVVSVTTDRPKKEGHDDEFETMAHPPQTLEAHTLAVVQTVQEISTALALDPATGETLRLAALWHDAGKAHEVFQAALHTADPTLAPDAIWAKSGSRAPLRFARKHFRHELASALAWRTHAGTHPAAALVTYLIAAHHGKVRLAVRALPGEREPEKPDHLFACGIWDGDTLPPLTLCGETRPETALSLAPMRLGLGADGQPSWLECSLALRDAPTLGPFRLAYLETLLRAADMRASRHDNAAHIADAPAHDLAGKHPPLAATSRVAKTPDPLGGDPGGRGAEHGLRAGAGAGGDDSRDTRPDRATRFVETTRGILSYSDLAPLLAERVAKAEAELYRDAFATRALDGSFLQDLHARICGDLVPEWAGRWRTIEVRVGNLDPALSHEIAARMLDYGRDLEARWAGAAGAASELTLEFLAFAEGRFLTIHPFRDFNGRTIRLFLLELLRRLDFPRVILAAEGDTARAAYFTALEAADASDWRPLVEIWRTRLEQASV